MGILHDLCRCCRRGPVLIVVRGAKGSRSPDEGFYALVSMTVLLCAQEGPPIGYGLDAGPSWSALVMLGLTDFGW